MDSKGYYSILQVDKNSTVDQIRSAFKKRALELHPDKNDNPDAVEQFQKLNEAHSVLSDNRKRQLYDNEISEDFSFDFSAFRHRNYRDLFEYIMAQYFFEEMYHFSGFQSEDDYDDDFDYDDFEGSSSDSEIFSMFESGMYHSPPHTPRQSAPPPQYQDQREGTRPFPQGSRSATSRTSQTKTQNSTKKAYSVKSAPIITLDQGQVTVSWSQWAPLHTNQFQLYAIDTKSNLEFIVYTGKKQKTVLTSLDPGQFYSFRVVAVPLNGPTTESDISKPVKIPLSGAQKKRKKKRAKNSANKSQNAEINKKPSAKQKEVTETCESPPPVEDSSSSSDSNDFEFDPLRRYDYIANRMETAYNDNDLESLTKAVEEAKKEGMNISIAKKWQKNLLMREKVIQELDSAVKTSDEKILVETIKLAERRENIDVSDALNAAKNSLEKLLAKKQENTSQNVRKDIGGRQQQQQRPPQRYQQKRPPRSRPQQRPQAQNRRPSSDVPNGSATRSVPQMGRPSESQNGYASRDLPRPMSNPRICKYYQNGKCYKGPYCTFSHVQQQ